MILFPPVAAQLWNIWPVKNCQDWKRWNNLLSKVKIWYNYSVKKGTYMLPKSVKNVLWSEKIEDINPEIHKKLIIGQVLNYGDQNAVSWLLTHYNKKILKNTASQIPRGQWDKKSLALWSLILGIKPKERKLSVE